LLQNYFVPLVSGNSFLDFGRFGSFVCFGSFGRFGSVGNCGRFVEIGVPSSDSGRGGAESDETFVSNHFLNFSKTPNTTT